MSDNENDIHIYDDIISLPRHVSQKHPRMSASNRAAQFLPFAALTGYDEAVKETARLTDERAELSQDELQVLNDRFHILLERLDDRTEVIVTYFVADEKKSGGRYETVRDIVKKIDICERMLFLKGGKAIPMDDVYGLDCESF